jgi:hypothetical protein
VCDLDAFRRGHTHLGETCRIVGGSPIPVALARELAEDSFLKALLHDCSEIHTVAHFGRHIPAVLRTALELGAPPDFDGVSCTGNGCDRKLGLEWDHVEPFVAGGPTSKQNLQPKCKPCHWEKTQRDRTARRRRQRAP